jgi:hypothetical protein
VLPRWKAWPAPPPPAETAPGRPGCWAPRPAGASCGTNPRCAPTATTSTAPPPRARDLIGTTAYEQAYTDRLQLPPDAVVDLHRPAHPQLAAWLGEPARPA